MIKLGLLCDYPINNELIKLGIKSNVWHPGSQPVINLIEGLSFDNDIVINIITTTKIINKSIFININDNIKLHILPIPNISGMITAFIPRIIIINKYINNLNLDIVHGQGTEGEYSLAAITSKYPNIITVHGILREVKKYYKIPLWNPGKLGVYLEYITLKYAKNINSISKYAENIIKNISKGKIYNIANPVNDKYFNIEKDIKNNTILFIGSICKAKGFMDLLKAAEIIENKKLKYIWKIIGKPIGYKYDDNIKYYNDFINNNLKNQKFEFLGWLQIEKIIPHLVSTICVVLPSYCENSPMVVAETMASSTPIISTNVGGIPELIDNGKSGFVINVGNYEELANTIIYLNDNKDIAINIGREARLKAKKYDKILIAHNTMNVYKEILKINI